MAQEQKSLWNPCSYGKSVYGTPFLQGNLGETQVYYASLKVHHTEQRMWSD